MQCLQQYSNTVVVWALRDTKRSAAGYVGLMGPGRGLTLRDIIRNKCVYLGFGEENAVGDGAVYQGHKTCQEYCRMNFKDKPYLWTNC